MAILAAHPAGMTLTEMAAAAGLTRAGARRLLLTLVAAGYAAQDGRRFMLTPRLLGLARQWLEGTSLWSFAEPHMREVAARAEGILLGRGAVRRGCRLCRARSRRAHHERRAACRHPAAGLVHLDGPRAAVGSGDAGTARSLPRPRGDQAVARKRRSPTARASAARSAGRGARLSPWSTRSWRSACARSPCRSATAPAGSSRRSTSRRSRPLLRRRDEARDPAAACSARQARSSSISQYSAEWLVGGMICDA